MNRIELCITLSIVCIIPLLCMVQFHDPVLEVSR